MGRPLKKDVNGVEVIGSTTVGGAGDAGIVAEFYNGSLVTTGSIVKQRGAKTYVVADDSDIDADRLNSSAPLFTCVLQAEEPEATGQMRVAGYTETGGDPIYVAKFTKRVATDFDGNKYNWFMVNYEDSTGDEIRLVPIA
jgi:hypothetical protein